jgi:hypothetical protein
VEVDPIFMRLENMLCSIWYASKSVAWSWINVKKVIDLMDPCHYAGIGFDNGHMPDIGNCHLICVKWFHLLSLVLILKISGSAPATI